MYLSIIIVLLYSTTVSDALWIESRPTKKLTNDLIEDIATLRQDLSNLLLHSSSPSSSSAMIPCKIKLYNNSNFRGGYLGITKAKSRFLYRPIISKIGHIKQLICGFGDVGSIQVLGDCCWKIYR